MGHLWAPLLLCCLAVCPSEGAFRRTSRRWSLRHGRLLHQLEQQPGDEAGKQLLAGWTWDRYHTEVQTEAFLKSLAAVYNDTCSLKSIGLSAQGKELYVLTITSNVTSNNTAMALNQTFSKPVMTYIGNMHGDEDINREMLLQFALELCSAGSAMSGQRPATDMATAQRIQSLLDNTIIHILPCMNPDGAFVNPPQRLNSVGVDLNRNFWTFDFPYDKPQYSTPGVDNSTAAQYFLSLGGVSPEPETRAVGAWLRDTPPRLSANLHGGELVASYLLDACDTLGVETMCLTVHGSLPRFLANAYTAKVPALRNSSQFVNGTIRGAAWYPALGTLQDWMFWTLGQQHITLELHEVKTLAGSRADVIRKQLPSYYPQHRQGLLRLAELSHLGLRAHVVDNMTGVPLAVNISQVLPLLVQYPPVTQPGQELSVMLTPGLAYQLELQPYDVCQPDTKYPVVQLQLNVPYTWDGALAATGITNLTLFRHVRVEPLPPSPPSPPPSRTSSPSPLISDDSDALRAASPSPAG